MIDTETCIGMCRGLAKAYSTAVRLYEGETCLFYYSVSHIRPDPLDPHLRKILDCEAEAGIPPRCTSFMAFYVHIRRVILCDIQRNLEKNV